MNARSRRRLQRRMTHRSRSAITIVVLAVLIVALAYVGVEAVLAALEQPALLASPAAMVETVSLPANAAAAAAALAVIGVVLIVLALAPARSPRRVVTDARSLIVADDTVIAGALSRAASDAAGVRPAQVRTALTRRVARIQVQPTSGFPITSGEVRPAVADALAAASLVPAPSLRVAVAAHGRTLP